MIRDGKRAPVEVIHDSGKRQERDRDHLDALQARRFLQHGVSSGALQESMWKVNWFGLFVIG
jgi:hypothetical protein